MAKGVKVIDAEKENKEAFDVFAKDGNECINVEQLRYISVNLGEKLSDEDIAEMLKQVDFDGDGVANNRVEWCKKAWTHLRSEFFKKLAARDFRSGDGGEEDIYVKWPHFRSMQFLIKYHNPRSTTSNLAEEFVIDIGCEEPEVTITTTSPGPETSLPKPMQSLKFSSPILQASQMARKARMEKVKDTIMPELSSKTETVKNPIIVGLQSKVEAVKDSRISGLQRVESASPLLTKSKSGTTSDSNPPKRKKVGETSVDVESASKLMDTAASALHSLLAKKDETSSTSRNAGFCQTLCQDLDSLPIHKQAQVRVEISRIICEALSKQPGAQPSSIF